MKGGRADVAEKRSGTAMVTTKVWETATARKTAWMAADRRRGIGENRKMVTTVRPLLQNLVRICVNTIDNSCDIYVRVLLNQSWDSYANNNSAKNKN